MWGQLHYRPNKSGTLSLNSSEGAAEREWVQGSASKTWHQRQGEAVTPSTLPGRFTGQGCRGWIEKAGPEPVLRDLPGVPPPL